MSDESLKAIESLEEQLFNSAETFLTTLQSKGNLAEIDQHQDYILQKTKKYFRLDPWITHKGTREWIEALLFALVVAVVIRTFLFAPFKVPSGSMLPTIFIGDHLFATRFSYGLPIPFTDTKINPQPIQRGDIVIFPSTQDPDIDYIKRVVALGGEKIMIENDQVYIDGKPLQEPYAFFDPTQRSTWKKASTAFDQSSIFHTRNYGPEIVPEGHLFVMGDNRYNSYDSRFWGFVDAKTVAGKAGMIYWSHDPREGLFGGYNLQRMFHFFHAE